MKDTLKQINFFLNNSECSEFTVKSFDGVNLQLVGSFDLSYYHEIEIHFLNIERIRVDSYFFIDRFELKNPTDFLVSKPLLDNLIEFTFQSSKNAFHTFLCEDIKVIYPKEVSRYHDSRNNG